MKSSKRIFHHATLVALSTMVLMLSPLLSKAAMAADSTNSESARYQSSFDDFKPQTSDGLADWKVLNQESATNAQSMPGMSGNSEMSNMPGMDMSKSSAKSDSSDMSNMQGMDHSKMQGMNMDKTAKQQDNSAMSNMPGMDMGKSTAKSSRSDMSNMPSMDHSKMQDMTPALKTDNADSSSMKGMDHSKMKGMDKTSKKSNSSDRSNMPDMNMSDLPTKSGHNNMSNMQDMNQDSKSDSSDMSSMQSMEHSKMKPMNSSSATAQAFQIIPNFHPIVVHFPIALTVVALLLSIAAYTRRSHPVSLQLAAAGHFILWLAAFSAAIAVLFGWLAFNSITNHDDAGHAAMLLHRSWAIPTAIGLILLASWDAWKHRVNELMSVPILFGLLLLSQAIAVTGWLGGEVVYRYGIGVLAVPSSDAAGHAHQQGADTAIKANASPDAQPEQQNDGKGESHEH